MIPQSEKLLERARKGERLTSSERRACLAYLMVTHPEYTNVALGEMFGVHERQIRKDRETIRKEKAKLIKEEDIGFVIADIAISFDNQVRDIEKSKKKCDVGTRTYLEHCKAIFELQIKKVNALQELGFYPKNIGNMTVEKFEYKAVVSADGSVDTRPVNLLMMEQENADRAIIEGEFEDVKRLPAPTTA